MSYAATILGANSSVGSGNNYPSNANDSAFRGWTQLIANSFISAGWVRSSDTGNINFATVSTPAAGSFVSGWDIFRMTDAMNVSAPVFVKVEYGSGAYGATYPQAYLTVCSGTNGAGLPIGAASQRMQMLSCGGPSTNAISSAVSGDTNRIHMALWAFSNTNFGGNQVSGLQNTMYLSIERTKDATGADTSEGVLITCSANQTFKSQQYWNGVTGSSGIEGTWGCLMPTANIMMTTGIQIAFYPIYHSKGVFLNPQLGTLCYTGNSSVGGWSPVTEGCPIVIPVYGSNHTYMPLSAICLSSISARTTTTATWQSLVMRYE
jgi:hypothetical protein